MPRVSSLICALLLAVVCYAVGSEAASGATGGAYYWNVRGARTGTHTLTLDRAHVQGGHVAVWAGADNGARWVQAGIAVGEGDGRASVRPYVYLERTGGHIAIVGPARYGRPVRVTVSCAGNSCAVTVSGRTMRAYIPGWKATVEGESWELSPYQTAATRNSYAATVDGRRVSR